MPNVFLRDGGSISAGDAARVIGRAGAGERVFLDAATTDVRLDANIERIDLDRRLSDLTFAVTDDGLRITADGAAVVTLPSLNQETALVTRSGTLTLEQVGATTFEAVRADGQASQIDRGGPIPVELTPDPGTAQRPPMPESPVATVFLDPDETMRVREPVDVFGPGTGDATLTLAAGARGVRADANITRLELPQAFDAVDMRVTDDGLVLAADGTALVTLPSLNQALEVAFSDGEIAIAQTGPVQFEVVGAGTTATVGRDGLDGDVVPGVNPGGDGAPTVAVADARAVEGGALAFDVTTTNLPVGATLDYTVTTESAAAADIRGSLTGTVAVAGRDGGATVVVQTADDAEVEPATETIALAVEHPQSAVADTATGSIEDNDDGDDRAPSASVPELDVSDASSREGGTLRFDVTSTDLPPGAEIDWRLDFASATPADVAGASEGTAVLTDGTATIAVDAAEDTAIETGGPETFELSATNRATGARATATGEIVDNDGAADAEDLTVTAPTTTEGGTLTFAVIAPETVTFDRRFAWELDLDGTPPNRVASETSGEVTIPAGSTRAEISIATVDNDVSSNGPGTVSLRLGDGAGATLAEGTGTIRDNDPAIPPDVPVLALGDATAREGETLKIPVALNQPAPRDIGIVGGLDSDRAAPGVNADDFPGEQVSSAVMMAEGDTNAILRLPTADDDRVEGTETFGVSATSPDLAETEVRFGEATILDNDGSADAARSAARTDDVDPMLG